MVITWQKVNKTPTVYILCTPDIPTTLALHLDFKLSWRALYKKFRCYNMQTS